ncbi:hypothetical protein LVJ94_02070 [Pendulispora rubella]|uniref:Uncharacterized protein n=1 Tax=Pendulispora rubella TaxID=2741070 RepID=A0ABZ2L531_9BACT
MKVRSLVLAFALLTAAACASSNDDNDDAGRAPPGPMHPAVASFFDDFHASRYSLAARHAQALDGAAAAAPQDGPVSFVRGLAHLWHVGEFARDPRPNGPALETEARASLELFSTAKQKNPDDARVDCFLGLQQLNAGRAIHDDALVQQGYATLEAGVRAWPQFSLFCKSLAYDGLPASDPDYAKAVDAAFDTYEACFGEKADRNHPDISKYLDRATDTGPNRACWNDWIAPHNAEGFYLYWGDLLVKQGKVDVARIVYNNAKLVKEYPKWPYKSLLDDRLNANLQAKAALYWDADPKNDPPLGGASAGHACTYCHAATADE